MSANLILKRVNRKQCSDSGLAFTLILLLAGFISGIALFYQLAIPALIISMIVPGFYYPWALVWLSLANILGLVMPKVILTLIFSLFVIPVGFIRKIAGKDDLQLRLWKAGGESVFQTRNHTYKADDLKHPY